MEYHGLKPIPDIPGQSEKLFQKHLLEAHGIKYVEKKKGEKNYNADSLSIGPSLTKTMVVFVLKDQNRPANLAAMCQRRPGASTSVGLAVYGADAPGPIPLKKHEACPRVKQVGFSSQKHKIWAKNNM